MGMRPRGARKADTMSNRWRIVNPALLPAQVVAESGDEQAIFREYATRDASANGFKLLKSEDDGKTWVEVEARAPEAASAMTAAEKSDEAFGDRSRHEGSKKASK